jgi:hypothetical protein
MWGQSMTDLRHENHANDLGFEREDLTPRPVIGFIVSLVIAGVLIYYIIWGMFYFLDAYDKKNQQVRTPLVEAETNTREVENTEIRRFPEPRLEQDERTELDGFRYGEEERLNSYGWVDEKAGIAHIPISEAMHLIAQRGLPTTPQVGTMPLSPVNLARAAAKTSDTSSSPNTGAQPTGKKP